MIIVSQLGFDIRVLLGHPVDISTGQLKIINFLVSDRSGRPIATRNDAHLSEHDAGTYLGEMNPTLQDIHVAPGNDDETITGLSLSQNDGALVHTMTPQVLNEALEDSLIHIAEQRDRQRYPALTFQNRVGGNLHRPSKPLIFSQIEKIGREIIPNMFESSEKYAQIEAQALIEKASTAMTAQLQMEIDRLKNLRKLNDHVRPEEIKLAQEQLTKLAETINKARIRLDAIRLIWKGDPEAIRG